MARTHVILDGLQDAELAQLLSRHWTARGFVNAVDPSGQCGYLSVRRDGVLEALDESQMDQAAAIARAFGLELRDRAGKTYQPENDLTALRGQMVYEYKSRFATALVFVLPALAIHYLGPWLSGQGHVWRGLSLAWLMELALVGWACLAAGWPLIWQGGLAMVHLRTTGDLLTAMILLTTFAASAWDIFSLGWRHEPLFAPPVLHVTGMVLLAAVLQRWMAHRHAAALSGHADRLIARFDRIAGLWLVVSCLVAVGVDWQSGLAVAMLFPPMIGLGGVQRLTPGVLAFVPIPAFAALMVVMHPGGPVLEIALGFQVIMIGAMVLGWSGMRRN